jgi:hypothetical protein
MVLHLLSCLLLGDRFWSSRRHSAEVHSSLSLFLSFFLSFFLSSSFSLSHSLLFCPSLQNSNLHERYVSTSTGDYQDGGNTSRADEDEIEVLALVFSILTWASGVATGLLSDRLNA